MTDLKDKVDTLLQKNREIMEKLNKIGTKIKEARNNHINHNEKYINKDKYEYSDLNEEQITINIDHILNFINLI